MYNVCAQCLFSCKFVFQVTHLVNNRDFIIISRNHMPRLYNDTCIYLYHVITLNWSHSEAISLSDKRHTHKIMEDPTTNDSLILLMYCIACSLFGINIG